ncbi:uncharacterized protein LOC117918583 [Vitis riparia]|uniref:uncharacterized protein LOC117918583 n=1 Tax=Vitis riparia TaxID=96939 RepID=UPI00155A2D85|nr:uncharacterized protein LOC117918583 [Vitis riparia]
MAIDRHKGCSLLPGSIARSWSEIEHNSFLLGLYIFGKNFLPVKRFMESKKMGDILSFYYGEFYQSDAYRRWSECRKMKSRRCIHGQRIFTGWRQQELLSRLFSEVSEQCKNRLVEVSRAYGEGKFLLEEYVFVLKDAVGIHLLIEAVGIGQGKQDLTGIAMEPIKTHRVFSLRPEIPIGKACSLLTSREIIKFLTGDFRLSKARSSDLFWEAVWPRLLAKGWHSEQPNDQGTSGSKHPLVFLIPGIKKFSRKKLVKGNHYFDSVSDILTKVVSDPGLLELEIEATKGSENKEEYRWDAQIEEDTDDLSNQKRHCYLQPRTSTCYQDLMKFTIVDTSSVHGEEQAKMIALKSLPIDTTDIFTHPSLFNETEQNTPEEYEDETEVTNASVSEKNLPDRGACANSPEHVSSILNSGVPNEPCLTTVAVASHEGQKDSVFNEKRLRKTTDYEFSQKVKSVHSNLLAPVPKRPRLIVCGNGESSRKIEKLPADSKAKEEKSHCRSNPPGACEKMVVQVVLTQNLSSASSSAKGSPDESNEGTRGESCPRTQPSLEKPEPRQLIDLNVLPSMPPELAVYEPLTMQTVANHGNLGANESSVLPETSQQPEPPKLLDGKDSKEQQSMMNGRRHSTRNRPLSTKALEALASGFFNTTRKRRGAEALQQKNSTPKSSRQVRGRTAASGTLNNDAGNNTADFRIEKGRLDGASSSNAKVVDESQE